MILRSKIWKTTTIKVDSLGPKIEQTDWEDPKLSIILNIFEQNAWIFYQDYLNFPSPTEDNESAIERPL